MTAYILYIMLSASQSPTGGGLLYSHKPLPLKDIGLDMNHFKTETNFSEV